jgi:Electron transfer DM13
MKHILTLFVMASSLFLFSCKKSALENVQEQLPSGTVLKSGNFVSNSHPTSGTAKIITGVDNKKFLTIENFSSDNGPDLRVWLSPNNNGSPYQELGTLKAISGSFSYELNANIDYTANNRVLIWCEDFSVLFGHAVLQ